MTAHKHAALMALYAQDALETETPWERWQFQNLQDRPVTWRALLDHPIWNTDLIYRRKPKTIRIGEFDVPEPLREAPEENSSYWLADPTMDYSDARPIRWWNDHRDREWLEGGLLHNTKEAAELHAKALLSFTAKQ